MTLTQSRKPSGTPTGGQFAAAQHGESAVALTPDRVIENLPSVLDEAAALRSDPRGIDSVVSLRLGERELDDRTAVAIAQELGESFDMPRMAEFGRTGTCRPDELYQELSDSYQDSPNPVTCRRMDMMFTWALHGSDNA